MMRATGYITDLFQRIAEDPRHILGDCKPSKWLKWTVNAFEGFEGVLTDLPLAWWLSKHPSIHQLCDYPKCPVYNTRARRAERDATIVSPIVHHLCGHTLHQRCVDYLRNSNIGGCGLGCFGVMTKLIGKLKK